MFKKVKFWQAVFLTAFAIRLLYLFITPISQTPDEFFVFERIWATAYNPPNHQTHFPNNEYFYPPLYFTTAAFLLKTAKPQTQSFEESYSTLFLPFRIISLILSTTALFFIWKILASLKISNTIKNSSFAFIALLPSFTSFSIFLNHNVLLFFLLTLFTYIAAKNNLEPKSYKSAAALGIVFGLAILTKFDAFIMLPAFMLIALKQVKKTNFKFLCAFLLFATIAGGWWYIGNLIKFGWIYDKPLFEASIGSLIKPFSFENYISYVAIATILTFFATFGVYNNLFISPMAYAFFIIVIGISVFGFVRKFSKEKILKLNNLPKIYTFLLIMFVANLGIFLLWNLKNALQPQGRYFFPSIILISVAFSWGLSNSLKQARFLPLVIFICGIVFNLWSFSCMMHFYYDLPLPRHFGICMQI